MSREQTKERRQTPVSVTWLVAFRLLLAVACLAIILLQERGRLRLEGGGGFIQSRFFCAYVLLVAVCALDLFYLLVIRTVRRPERFAMVQVLLDVLAITGLIYFTGGVRSHFNVLYFAAIVSAAITVSGRSSLLTASLSTLLLAGVAIVYFIGAYRGVRFPFVDESWFWGVSTQPSAITSYMLAQAVAYHVVALLSGRLAASLGRAQVVREALLRDMAEGVIAVDVRGRIIFMNDKAKEFLGFEPDLAPSGKKWDEVFKRKSDEKLKTLLLKEPPGEYTVELYRTQTQQGKMLVRLKTSVLLDDRRDRIGMLIDLRPLQRMREAERRADRLEEIAELAAGIAHEIRNPLASIRACVQELREYEAQDEDSRQLMEIVFRESDRLEEIISDFLKFASVQPLRRRRCELGGILKDCVSRLRQQVQDDRIKIETDISYPLYCVGDEKQLEQVASNLGRNAIDAMPGGGTLRISAGVDFEGGQQPGILITFSDTGEGISDENLNRIFTPFFSTKETGRGMGLSIASRIVRMHNGWITVESTRGEGSCFRVWLPCENGAQGEI